MLTEKMQYEIIFHENKSFVTIRTSGDLTFDGLQLMLTELLGDPKWNTSLNALVDNRAASLDTLTLYDMQKLSLLVTRLKDNLGYGACAIVLPDDADFTKIAMWKIMTEPAVRFKIEYFDSIVIATEWLDKS